MIFYPDHSGIALYSSDFAFYAAEKGHEVTVVTGFPFYPMWQKSPEDKRKLFRKDKAKDVTILRGYLYVPQKPSTKKRIFQELTFLFFAFINFFRVKKPDVIVIFTTPLSLGLVGAIFKRIYRCELVINIQDFQIEAADSLGMVGKFSFIKLLEKIERYSYKKADIVSSISDSMVELVKEKGIKPDKIYLWPNWINIKDYGLELNTGSFRKKYSIKTSQKIIGYAGNIGLKQGLQTLIDLAEQFKDDNSLLFIIIGEGGDLQNLKDYHAKKNIANIRFIPFLNQTEYKEFLSDADAIFVSQKKTTRDIYFPSKLLGLMSVPKLLFLSADKESELYKVLKNNQLGMVCEYGDLPSMKNCVSLIKEEAPIIEKYKENAFSFVQQYDRESVLNNALTKISGNQ